MRGLGGPRPSLPSGTPPGRVSRRRWNRTVKGLHWALLGGLGVLVVGTLRTPDRPSAWLDNWFFHAVVGLAVVLTAARPLLRRGERPAWSLVAAGMLAWLVGDVWWQIAVEPLGVRAPSPNVSDVWDLLFYPCVVAALLLLTARHPGAARKTLWLDGLVAGLGVAAVAALAFDMLSGTSGSAAVVLVDLAYPTADLVLLAMTVAMLAARGWRLTPLWFLLPLVCVSMVVADTAFMLQETAGTYVQGSPWDLGWPAAFILVALAAWQPGRQQRRPDAAQPALVLPTMVTAVSAGLLVASVTQHIPTLAAVLAVLALLGAGVRTMLAFRELRWLVESRRLALTDDLTGLGNRRLLKNHLTALLDQRRPGDVLAVLLLGG